MATDDGRFADDDARAVVDEEMIADLRARVDVDAGGGMGQFGHHPRGERDALPVEQVRQPMVDHRPDARVADEHLVLAAGSRIALEGSRHVAVDQLAHLGQCLAEMTDHLHGPFVVLRRERFTARPEEQLAPHLLMQRGQRQVQRVAHVVVDVLGAQVGPAQPVRKERCRQAVHDLGKHRARRQQRWTAVAVLTRAQRAFAPLAQLRHHLVHAEAGRLAYRSGNHRRSPSGRMLSARQVGNIPPRPPGV